MSSEKTNDGMNAAGQDSIDPGAPILLFDSGLGGLTVLEEVRKLQPPVRREVKLRLSPSQRLLLGASLAVGVAFVREQGHER